MAEIVLQNPSALLALPLLWLLFVAFAWRRRFKPFGAFLLRLIIMVLVALALSQPVLLPPAAASEERQERLVVLVDRSASLTETDRQIFQAETLRLTEQFSNTVVLHFADRAVVEFPLNRPVLDEEVEQPPLNPEVSNLASALTMGARMLSGRPGRLVLMSDGLPTEGDTAQAVAQLARQNIPVDVLVPGETPVETPGEKQNEVRLVKLTVPPVLRKDETFDIEVMIHSERAVEVNLALIRDNNLIAKEVVSLEAGLNLFTFAAKANEPGSHTFRAVVTAAGTDDGQPANNSLSAFSRVYPAPQILVVSDEPIQTIPFTNQLKRAGFVPRRMRPQDLPDRLSDLEPFAGMVLLDVSARSLKLEQMIAVQEFVRSLGRGLLVTGGRDSYSLGHYEDTPLEELLPLSLEPPPREERPPVALLLIIDHSGSMVEQQEPATKLTMAKEAAIRATDILGPEDLIGVLIFDNEYEWVVPFQRVSDGAELLRVQQNIAAIPGGGGTRILQALEVALPALAEQEAVTGARHAVLLSDGKSFDGARGIEDYEAVVDAALEANITLSTIAIGAGADEELLTRLAERGRGRYHFAPLPDELPALTIAESDILRSNAVQEGEYRPAIFAPHPILRGLFTGSGDNCLQPPCLQDSRNIEMPLLRGYVALTPKPRTEMVLQVGPGDPLLGVWGYGLGRVAAWTSDADNEWTGDWRSWSGAARFWGQVVGYTLPAPDLGLLQLEAKVESNGVVTLTAEGVTATGQTIDLAPTQATLITPARREIGLTLRQVAPGRYQQQLHLPDPGAYQFSVTQARIDEPDVREPQSNDETATIGFVVPYPAEYGLPGEGAGQALLRRIAADTGGRIFSPGEPLRGTNCEPSDENCGAANPKSKIQNPKPVLSQVEGSKIDLWPWLLQIALILWPIEIAWRRWGRLRIQ